MAGLKNSVGTPVEELGIKAENHVILMASGHLESARELKQLKGSFLTKAICEGITNKLQEADADKDGALSLQDLRKWLENRAVLHNRNHPDQRVPIPQQFGRGRGDFYLTVRVTWQPFEIMWPDGSTMIALPKIGTNGRVACISKAPVLNSQYKEFVRETGHPAPEALDTKQRVCRPWDDPRFNSDDQPVVCVSYFDAVTYCRWVTKRSWAAKKRLPTKLPAKELWDLAAFGTEFPSWDPAIWQKEHIWPRNRIKAPFGMRPASTVNRRGLFPMLGNVWEWCAVEGDRYTWDKVPAHLQSWQYPGEIRGGSYLENLRVASEPKLHFDQFPDGIHARHLDIGFRIASEVPLRTLPTDLQRALPRIDKKKKRPPAKKRWRPLRKK
jgi:hypothetical protein